VNKEIRKVTSRWLIINAIANELLKNAAKLNCLGVTVTNQNPIYTAIVSELN
jgi:hypothetical protein